MPTPVPLLLLSLLAAPGPGLVDGVWLPMSGSAAERAVQTLAAGPDGVLWAAGAGEVHRLDPGQPWRVVGRYAPEIEWDGGQRVSVRGALPPAMLREVIDELRAAVESAGGVDPDEGTVGGESFDEFVAAFVEEAEQAADNPYRVHAAVAGPRLVWLGTGAGLFRATNRGVQGPLPGVPGPVVSLASGQAGIYAATPGGLFRFDVTGAVRPLVPGDVRAVATLRGAPPGDEVAFVADGRLWRWSAGEGARPLPAPPVEPRLLAAHDGQLWVADETDVYRVAGDGSWAVCGALTDTPARLVVDDGVLAVVTEDALLIAPDDCRELSLLPVPWPGGMRLLDAARVGGSWFMSATLGVFVLAPAVPEAEEALAMAGFQRALRQMPSFNEVARDALAAAGLERSAVTSGSRVGWSYLLPRVVAQFEFDARRKDTRPLSLVGGRTLDLEPPKANFLLMARWTVPVDTLMRSFGGLFATAATPADEVAVPRPADDPSEGAEDPDVFADDGGDVDEARAADELSEDLAAEGLDGDVATAVGTGGDGDSADGDLVRPAMAEQRLRAKERVALVRRVQKLYRQRQGTLYRVWAAAPPDLRGRALLLVELEEIDALLDAYTAGAYGRRLARAGGASVNDRP